jgi:hypothetical protein
LRAGRVSADLLGPHDAALAAVDADPLNMTAAVKWMDACDRIAEGMYTLGQARTKSRQENGLQIVMISRSNTITT